MGKRVTVPISTARKQLFHLTDLVRKSGDDTVVILQQRGGVEAVALVRETRLAYLEAQVREHNRTDKAPFTLAGSLATHLDDHAMEQALRDIRSEWTPRLKKEAGTRSSRKVAGRPR